MVKSVSQHAHQYIGYRQSSDRPQCQAAQNCTHAFWRNDTQDISDDGKSASGNHTFAFSDFTHQRPEKKDAKAKRRLTDSVHDGISRTVVIFAKHPVCVVKAACNLEIVVQVIDNDHAHDHDPILALKASSELFSKRKLLFFSLTDAFLRHALTGEIVLQKNSRQCQNRNDAHDRDPFSLIHIDNGKDQHRKQHADDSTGDHT